MHFNREILKDWPRFENFMVEIPSAIKLTFNKILIFDRDNMHLG